MGKWSNLKSKLDPFAQEPEYQQRVEQVKSEYAALSAPELARAFGAMRQSKQEHEASLKNINLELEALSQLLCAQLEAQGLTKLGLDSGATCFVQVEPYSATEDVEVLNEYAYKHKMKGLMRLPWQTINSMNKERLIDGQPPLPGTKVFLKTSARIRGANDGE